MAAPLRRSRRDAIHKAGLDGLRFQDLRRTAVVRLTEAGCTDPEIAAITGHSLERTRQTYLPAPRRWPATPWQNG